MYLTRRKKQTIIKYNNGQIMIVLTGQVDGEQVPRPPAVVWAAWFGIGTCDVTVAHVRYCRPVQYVSTKTLVR